MTPSEITCYIAAAAWLPMVARGLYHSLAKPKLKFDLWDVEVSHAHLGPIVKLWAYFSAEHRGVLITSVKLVVTHARYGVRHMRWYWFEEPGNQSLSISIPLAGANKGGGAHPLPVEPANPVNKVIGFVDPKFLESAHLIKDKIHALVNKSQGQGRDLLKSPIVSAEYEEILKLFQKEMYWREGNYSVRVEVEMKRGGRTHVESFSFSLGPSERLGWKPYAKSLEQYIHVLVDNKTRGEAPRLLYQIDWNWLTVNLEERDEKRRHDWTAAELARS